jgi:hypothetical protein
VVQTGVSNFCLLPLGVWTALTRDTSFKVTGFGLDDRGSISDGATHFSLTSVVSRPALGPIQLIRGLFLRE